MPNLHSALKRMRLAEKARLRNRSVKSQISTLRRKTFEVLAGKDNEKSREIFRQYCSALDKAAKKGMIARNTAIRRKRRAANKLSVLA